MAEQNSYINLMLSLLLRKVTVPQEFHEQYAVTKDMLRCDTSGLVDSLTNFQIESALVNIKIDTDNDKLDEILNEDWLENLNSEFRGQGIQTGLKGLMKEYFSERWKGATFPVLKITKWKEIDGINLPVSMFFVDGGSVYAKDKKDSEEIDLIGYDYFLGKNKKEQIKGEAYFMYKPFTRWFEKYPIPYLIRRGIYKNWKIIDIIKNKELELVDQVIPYLLLVMKGTEKLALEGDVTYDKTDLENTKIKIQELIDKLNKISTSSSVEKSEKSPIRVTNFDEEIKHLIPDLKALFEKELFVSAERNILAGMGFIDIVEATSTSRKESVLNPKGFIKEIDGGISDFKLIIKDLIDLIKEKNKNTHRKYNAKKWIITSSPTIIFLNERILTVLRSLSDRGLISNETISELTGNDYEIERRRRIKETRDSDDIIMYPKLIQNTEKDTSPLEIERLPKKLKNQEEESEEEIDDDKTGTEKQNFNQAKLIGAPYETIKELPEYIRNKFGIEQQRKWMKIWNNAYKFYLKKFKGNKKKAEALAFRTANSRLSKSFFDKVKRKIIKAMIELLD